jgi:hypothetical protein
MELEKEKEEWFTCSIGYIRAANVQKIDRREYMPNQTWKMLTSALKPSKNYLNTVGGRTKARMLIQITKKLIVCI